MFKISTNFQRTCKVSLLAVWEGSVSFYVSIFCDYYIIIYLFAVTWSCSQLFTTEVFLNVMWTANYFNSCGIGGTLVLEYIMIFSLHSPHFCQIMFIYMVFCIFSNPHIFEAEYHLFISPNICYMWHIK